MKKKHQDFMECQPRALFPSDHVHYFPRRSAWNCRCSDHSTARSCNDARLRLQKDWNIGFFIPFDHKYYLIHHFFQDFKKMKFPDHHEFFFVFIWLQTLDGHTLTWYAQALGIFLACVFLELLWRVWTADSGPVQPRKSSPNRRTDQGRLQGSCGFRR